MNRPYLDPEKGRRVQKAFEQACGEMGVDDASEKMEAIVKEIKRLSKSHPHASRYLT